MLHPHHSADSDHRSANWGHSELGAQSGRKNQPTCLFACLLVFFTWVVLDKLSQNCREGTKHMVVDGG